ncbi:hypothetical protein AAG906_005405 [Vitis piasezkii]
MIWRMVDIAYLKHPISESLSRGLMKWRRFFQASSVMDFVQIIQVEKNVSGMSHMILKNERWDRDLVSHETITKDWESLELVQLLFILFKTGNQESYKNLLNVLDTLWDGCFSVKVTGYCNFKFGGGGKPFKSSLMTSIRDFQWIASSMDDELHYPQNLFYDSNEYTWLWVRQLHMLFQRTAAVNQKIKRTITEVLVKVTDELFDEIATKVLSKDDMTVELDDRTATSNHKIS